MQGDVYGVTYGNAKGSTRLGMSLAPASGLGLGAGRLLGRLGVDGDVVPNSSALGKITGSYSAIEPGPLADNLAGTFSGGRYTTHVLETDIVLYRAGTANQPLGQFFSFDPPTSVVQTRIDKAVLPIWPGGGTSPLDTYFAIKIPAGTSVHVGEVGSQGGMFIGGTQQVVVPKPWAVNGVQVINSGPIR